MFALFDRFTRSSVLRWFPLLALLPMLQACGGGSAAHESGLEWKGSPLPVESRTAVPDTAALRAAVDPIPLRHLPKRVLRVSPGEWGDSLRVFDFGGELEAYAAFQEIALLDEDIELGVTVLGDWICMRRGKWLILTDAWSWKNGDIFEQALSLPGAPLPTGIPRLFGSMVHQGRIPGSERVLGDRFLGLHIDVPVFSVQVDCHGDTARVYASPRLRGDAAQAFTDQLARLHGWQARGTASERRFFQESPDLPPATLEFSGRGMVAVEGCFDPKLTDFWLEMQARGLKSLK